METEETPRAPGLGIRRPSLLSARRPSNPSQPPTPSDSESDYDHEGEYEGDGGIRKSLEIDMKGLVGDAVGNMSISPYSRDVVLAARRGLFIIDLEAPLSVPRFLPQGGTWDVADVQWNPHPSRANYVVSTSSEKLLIWNLDLTGKTSIEHILHSHYRAITDINWHTTERDTVVSTGIDSWVCAWDLRETRKPVFRLCAFNSPGTQVKWNRKDPNILASSHSNGVLIWDRRKGSLPITTIEGHTSRIYGIDWSHTVCNEIVTCSLDKTIKLWDTNECASLSGSSSSSPLSPKLTINTTYPVWRARNLPFGKGILSLAQRGETTLEMYAIGDDDSESDNVAVKTFEGHTDVVKEFVWRRGGVDDSEYQLITWSKDRTLRFWPMDSEAMRKVGHTRPSRASSRSRGTSRIRDHTITATTDLPTSPTASTNTSSSKSFRNPPSDSRSAPLLSAPTGNRTILAEVRAGIPPVRNRGRNDSLTLIHPPQLPAPAVVSRPTIGINIDGSSHLKRKGEAGTSSSTDAMNLNLLSSTVRPSFHGSGPSSTGTGSGTGAGGTMSRGAAGNKSRAKVDALSWLSSVKLSGAGTGASAGSEGRSLKERVREGERGGSAGSGHGSGSRGNSHSNGGEGKGSRFGTGSSAKDEKDAVTGEKRKRSESRVRSAVEERDTNQLLQDEITSVLNKLNSSKVKLEKHDLTKKRTCTLGLQVPWGANSSIFLRITFAFPRDYPIASHPDGTPTINLEHSPLITIQDRAFILRRLRTIRESRRPCLEACLRFLLYRNEDEKADIGGVLDSESSSDEDEPWSSNKRDKEVTMSLLRNNKNLAEPRTSQGSFGPNGELVCFFRAPPRLVRHVVNNLSISPSKNPEMPSAGGDETAPRLFQSPSLVTEAVRRLSLVATDRPSKPIEPSRRGDNNSTSADHITRIMTNLLTFPRHRLRRESDSIRSESVSVGVGNQVAMVAPRRSTVIIRNTMTIAGGDRRVALDYIFVSGSVVQVCNINAEFARSRGRYDHERIFRALAAVLGTATAQVSLLTRQVLEQIISTLRAQKDVQMLAMVATIALQSFPKSPPPSRSISHLQSPSASIRFNTPKFTAADYFALSGHRSPLSPTGTPRIPSSPQPSMSTSASSRGSWSSLFNAGTMRHFMSGVQDTLKDGLSNPGTDMGMGMAMAPTALPGKWVAVPTGRSDRILRGPDSPGFRGGDQQRAPWKDSSLPVTPPITVSKSWNETMTPFSSSSSSGNRGGDKPAFSSAGHRKSSFLHRNSSRMKKGSGSKENWAVVFKPASDVEERKEPVFSDEEIDLLVRHVHFYAEILFRWELTNKRLEMLKSINAVDVHHNGTSNAIDLVRTCTHCSASLSSKTGPCSSCGNPSGLSTCSICRLSVRGLSINCTRCLHVTHISCWKKLKSPLCPTGCGCTCTAIGGSQPSSVLSRAV